MTSEDWLNRSNRGTLVRKHVILGSAVFEFFTFAYAHVDENRPVIHGIDMISCSLIIIFCYHNTLCKFLLIY